MNMTKQLILVDPLANTNRLFTMRDMGNGMFETCVERVDERFQAVDSTDRKRFVRLFPMKFWDRKLEEKLAEGYVDRGTLSSSTYKKFREIESYTIRKFWSRITDTARNAVTDHYAVQTDTVTLEMTESVQERLDRMYRIYQEADDKEAAVRECNGILVEVFQIIPRKMSVVSDFLITGISEEEFKEVLRREQELLDVMKAQIKGGMVEGNEQKTVLDALGISVRKCTQTEEEKLRGMMGNESHYFKRAFRVKNKKTHARHKAYMQERRLERKDDHLLFHGSRTMNLYGLLTQGPCLNPNAIRTGSLFGNATYFAKQALKSMRYTDIRINGTSYTQGKENSAYLLVYDVAYNNPLHIGASSKLFGVQNFTKERIAPHDVVYAHPGYDMGNRRLVNDEIMSYAPESGQVDIHYVIEIAQ